MHSKFYSTVDKDDDDEEVHYRENVRESPVKLSDVLHQFEFLALHILKFWMPFTKDTHDCLAENRKSV